MDELISLFQNPKEERESPASSEQGEQDGWSDSEDQKARFDAFQATRGSIIIKFGDEDYSIACDICADLNQIVRALSNLLSRFGFALVPQDLLEALLSNAISSVFPFPFEGDDEGR